MWDWTTAGAADAGRDKADFGIRRLFDGITSYSIGFHFRRTRSHTGVIFSESDVNLFWDIGFILEITGVGSDQIQITHDGVSSALSPVIALNTTFSYLISWDDTNGLEIFRDGVLWHADGAFVAVPTVPLGVRTYIGSDAERGPPGQLGNIAVWPVNVMFGPDAVIWHGGVMPHRNTVRFFHRCIEFSGRDEYSRDIPDCYRRDATIRKLPIDFFDNVALYIDPSDLYYDFHGETIHEEMTILAGEELHRRRLSKKSYKITVPTEFLTKDLTEDLQLTHKGGLECTGEGFGYGDAPERLVRIEGMALEPEDRTVGLTLKDMKRQAVSYYNAFRAPFTITGRQLGVFQLVPTYTAKETARASYSWGQDLGEIYQEYGLDQEPLAGKGLLVEGRKRNYVANSAFKHQFTSWVTFDPGAGTITAEAPDVKAFDDSITGYAVKMVCGPVPAADFVRILQSVVGVADTDMKFSFIYYAETAGALNMRIVRNSDGWYLQSPSGPFAAPNVGFEIPIRTAYKGPVRYVLPYVFNDPAPATGFTFEFYSQAVANKVIWLYHAQFEEGLFATGPVVNETTNAYVRQSSIVQLRNPDQKLLPAEHGTVVFEFEPLWADDEWTGSKYLFNMRYDADNYILFWWNSGASQWLTTFRFNAVSFFAAISGTSWSAGDTLKIAFRWLDAGELGKSTAQGQTFMKLGSGSWQSSVPQVLTEELQTLAEVLVAIGSWGTTGVNDEHNCADGYIRYLECFPEALPFEEIQALLGDPA